MHLDEARIDSRHATETASVIDLESERLRRAILRASRLNEQLADALGACHCFGFRSDCPLCGGQGRPGSEPVDPRAFSAFVAPVVAAEPELFQHFLERNAGATGKMGDTMRTSCPLRDTAERDEAF